MNGAPAFSMHRKYVCMYVCTYMLHCAALHCYLLQLSVYVQMPLHWAWAAEATLEQR